MSSDFVLFLYRVSSQAQLSLEAASGAEKCSSRLLTMVMMSSNEDTSSMVAWGFLISLNCFDHFPVDPAKVPVKALGHQLVTVCRSICAEERAQILDPVMGSKCFTTYFIAFVALLSPLCFSYLQN